MLALDGAILLLDVWVGDAMCNAGIFEVGIEFVVFSSPVRLYREDFSAKSKFNTFLKLIKKRVQHQTYVSTNIPK
jgi:hypothetical protein